MLEQWPHQASSVINLASTLWGSHSRTTTLSFGGIEKVQLIGSALYVPLEVPMRCPCQLERMFGPSWPQFFLSFPRNSIGGWLLPFPLLTKHDADEPESLWILRIKPDTRLQWAFIFHVKILHGTQYWPHVNQSDRQWPLLKSVRLWIRPRGGVQKEVRA